MWFFHATSSRWVRWGCDGCCRAHGLKLSYAKRPRPHLVPFHHHRAAPPQPLNDRIIQTNWMRRHRRVRAPHVSLSPTRIFPKHTQRRRRQPWAPFYINYIYCVCLCCCFTLYKIGIAAGIRKYNIFPFSSCTLFYIYMRESCTQRLTRYEIYWQQKNTAAPCCCCISAPFFHTYIHTNICAVGSAASRHPFIYVAPSFFGSLFSLIL